ncbi:Transcriptional regulatory protein LiaR [Kordia antarctica]|uniref:Transcriptional regulatory protein LiaR n=1 Tax=Kordia antarctica TaxID=1218801 RepID=A0A7L4ZNJ4_9FLAO|nr:response regulator transcription factor [Kordia antarctica]QHI38037.1 Transcriptional regulatory protein LiaR [Kordia antarctica]
MNKKINILIVEDSKSFAQGLEALLLQNSIIDQVFIATNRNEALIQLKECSVDIIILDLNLGTSEYDGIDIAKKIKQQHSKKKIIVLTENIKTYLHEQLFNECHVDAYIDKRSDIKETFTAINEIIKGNTYTDIEVEKILENSRWIKTTKREKQIISLLAEGLTQLEIAEQLFISPRTVEKHIRNLFEKFKVKKTTELIVKYIKYRGSNRENVEETIPPFKSI